MDTALSALSVTIAQIDEVKRETAKTYNDMTMRCLTGNGLSILVGYLASLDAKRADLRDEKSTIVVSHQYGSHQDCVNWK